MQTIFITGGTGSFGTAFIEACHKLFRIVVYSRDEFKQYELKKKYPDVTFILGDVRDRKRLSDTLSAERVDVIIHAAALKHITFAEKQINECIKTNIDGTVNVVNTALYHKVPKLILLSTDKAVNPINVYGASKFISERYVLNASYTVVRYGNVFCSRGSVIPYFKRQRETRELTLNDPEMTRFNITLDQAVNLVLIAINKGKGGEIFVPKLVSYKLKDLAKAICPTCKQITCGLVWGEKKHEELLTRQESERVMEFDKYYVVSPENKHKEFCYSSQIVDHLSVTELHILCNTEDKQCD